MVLLACVHLYPKMTSPHRREMDSSKHVTIRLCVGKCIYCPCVCVCVCVCVCARTQVRGEGSDLELILRRYPSLYRLILVRAE